ncbi:hypothetical protein PMAYCL1PPCAC_03003, partial [Pristionchus mayeri]
RFGNTQIHDRVQSNVGDPANEGPLKTPAARRGLADLGNANATRTVEKNKLLQSTNAFTPKIRGNLAPTRTNQSSRKLDLHVFEDVASPEKETIQRELEEDEEVDTCPTLPFGERSVFFKSMRNDTTILTDEKFETEYDEEEEEEKEENDEGGVERYFKLVYNVAENADAMWNNMGVEAHDSDTEIETCEEVDTKREEWEIMLDEIMQRSRLTDVQLVDSDEVLALERKWREEEEDEDSSSEVDDNDRSI